MSPGAEVAAAPLPSASFSPGRTAGPAQPTLGPAMRLMLTLAVARAQLAEASRTLRAVEDLRDVQDLQDLWDLAERYHPEQAWLAASWLRKERTMEELERRAPREGLAPGLTARLAGTPVPAHDLRTGAVFAQE